MSLGHDFAWLMETGLVLPIWRAQGVSPYVDQN